MGEPGAGRRYPDTSAAARRIGAATMRVLRGQASFIVASVLCLASAIGLSAMFDQSLRFGIYGDVQIAFFLNLAIACIILRVIRTLLRERPARPLRAVGNDLSGDFAVGRRLANALPAIVLLPLVLSAYTSLKTMIPMVASFTWDSRLAAMDARLHGGTAPWELLQPSLGAPAVTQWIDWAYGPAWFWMLLVLQFWQVFSLHAQRNRVLVTFVLCWALLGVAMAILFASAGPAYYSALVAGSDPFAPLLAYLHVAAGETQVLAVQAQAELWRTYLSGEVSLAAGISAMPSMHLSMGTLLVLATWRLGPIVRWLSGAYLALLLVGSVHLAWHYAIDGYAAIAGTWVLWWAVGSVLDRPGHRPRATSTTTMGS
jgi:hypothetical protein